MNNYASWSQREQKIWRNISIFVAIGSKQGELKRMTTPIEVWGNKKFNDVNRHNFNRGDVNRRYSLMI